MSASSSSGSGIVRSIFSSEDSWTEGKTREFKQNHRSYLLAEQQCCRDDGVYQSNSSYSGRLIFLTHADNHIVKVLMVGTTTMIHEILH